MKLHMGPKPDRDWESLCRRCGLCCYERTRVAGGVRIDLNKPCPYLEPGTRKCTVYTRRFAVGAACSKVNLFHALFAKRMPATCGYVRAYR